MTVTITATDDYNETDHDENLDPQWLDTLEALYTPRRYLQTALQMGAAYFLQVAPASTLTE